MKIDRSKVTSGRRPGAYRVGVYGPAAVGKSTFCAGAPEPFFLDIERGSDRLNVRSRVTPESWDETLAWVDEFAADASMGKTLVLDSVTRLESLLHRHLVGDKSTDTIESFGGGYGRGDSAAVQAFRELLAKLDRVRDQGRHVVLVAHAIVKKFEDPQSSGWERYELGMRPKLGGALAQWLDFLLFARQESVVIDPKAAKKRATATGERFAHTTWSAAYEAKARGELVLPDPLPLSWADFAGAVEAEERHAAQMRDELERGLKEIGDESYGIAARAYLAANPKRLVETHAKVLVRLGEVKLGENKKGKEVAA